MVGGVIERASFLDADHTMWGAWDVPGTWTPNSKRRTLNPIPFGYFDLIRRASDYDDEVQGSPSKPSAEKLKLLWVLDLRWGNCTNFCICTHYGNPKP